MHNHSHDHGHDHHNHNLALKKVGKAFVTGVILNVIFVIIESTAGLYYNSSALLADAGHNLTDVASLIIAMIAFRLAKAKPNPAFSYGYKKTTVLASFINSLLLIVAIIGIGYEATHKLIHPQPVQGKMIAIVAGVGILINAVTAFMFFSERKKDLNIKGAYLHMLADAGVSLGVVATGVAMIFTNWYWLDSFIGYGIMIFIFISTWKLLKDSTRLALDGVPLNVDMREVQEHILKTKGVKSVHHVHVWAISTTQNMLTAHIVTNQKMNDEQLQHLKKEIRHELLHLNIHHATLETEQSETSCKDEDCGF